MIQAPQASIDNILLLGAAGMAIGHELGEGVIVLVMVVVGNRDGGRRGTGTR